MTWNGNGVVDPPGGPQFPAIPGDLIRAEYYNLVVQQILDNFLNCLPRDGQAPMGGNIDMGNLFRLVNLPPAIANGQPVRFNEFAALQSSVAGLANSLEPFILFKQGVI